MAKIFDKNLSVRNLINKVISTSEDGEGGLLVSSVSGSASRLTADWIQISEAVRSQLI